ncbi:MAG: hypothetical protein OEY88_08910 [Candidatus Bathyarchaeota archaeon]|nr:hypothetical protein [Candidatus Bathyarchaeota archaeon]
MHEPLASKAKRLSIMDKEYLADYEKREKAEFERLVLKKIPEEKFDFLKDKYPPDRRFLKLQKPVTASTFEFESISDVWAQVPFCGSLILTLPALPEQTFSRFLFRTSNIPKIVDFIKETGRLQVVLHNMPSDYAGLDFFDPIFEELNPPLNLVVPLWVFGSEEEIQRCMHAFDALGNVKYFDFLKKLSQLIGSVTFGDYVSRHTAAYTILKLGRYQIVEEIENLMVDDPVQAYELLMLSARFITSPIQHLRYDQKNYSFEVAKAAAQSLPAVYQPQERRFPCEIGKFLLEGKLTYAPLGLDACKDVIYHYDAYDLRKLQESLNDAIVENHPDIINEKTEALSEILDNIWNDPTIPRQVKNLRRGLLFSIAAIGSATSALTGSWEGFLAGLGFSVGAKYLDMKTEGLSKALARFFARSYQANIFDFKQEYKHQIVKDSKTA